MNHKYTNKNIHEKNAYKQIIKCVHAEATSEPRQISKKIMNTV